ncbi:MAG: DUF5335 family protein [Gemmatimonadota bacterium]
MAEKIKVTDRVPTERWVEYFDKFSDGYHGRTVSLTVLDPSLGDEELIRQEPLQGIVYDPVGKGDDMVIETGQDTVEYRHIVRAPREVWVARDTAGAVIAMRIDASDGSATLVGLAP